MGWCSATYIFDEIVKALKDGGDKKEAIKQLIIALEDEDWDCQSDSVYWDDEEVKSIFKEMHPDWFKEE
jgi:hypothetical protein